ncbi:DegT/DnrJ/EryC1/StrS aminotransferase [Sulfurimonas gotlandica GD1]|uniref:DegT/DnrJ/EryC1/StrS aminotransferase n=1 Tax=Sulfurimonas gotlandica (strain DSM 19862 / JCM 16533 / GD1) TaxID=929558 RepID=B6BKI5_SULGG|nr:DegT/DnrJ/EryC1/StrS family aminotransferase [Sulfurimonas gotlandica]EDZ62335.1 aspartate aminotransferase [Sulfurimonas gotlandica GD1]EHP29040.1 DegT/DnrJ/EryC1/StrS aminotransferase [Sulfurimonas gotlandica GD1]
MNKLAINGGRKLRAEPFPAYNTIGKEEEEAALRVLRSGKLSTYLGAWHADFHGGNEVQSLEKEWAEYFNVKHAISVNSATSGLYAAVGAIGLNPGDEVIVSAYTMSASATAILVYGGIPVFADIEEDYYCLDVNSIREKITAKTKAIMVVDIFGQPYDADAINALAEEYGLKVIEDTAQAPNAKYGERYAGTLGDIGVFSLNYHKHIHCGEGGIIVTNDDELAFKLKLIRNHAEAVLGGKGYNHKDELINMIGFNYRMNEIEASIAREQLKKLPMLFEERSRNVQYLDEKLSQLPAINGNRIRKNTTHAFYTHTLTFDSKLADGIHRDKFIKAVSAELPQTILRDDSPVLMGCGYVKPLYLLPLYQERIAFGKDGYPFNLSTNINYGKGLCPVTEDMHYNKLFAHEFMRPGMKKKDMDDVVNAFEKVWTHRHEIC